METEPLTVSYDVGAELFTICDSVGAVIGQRVTPGGTIAELLDRGLSQEDAAAKVFTASRTAWQEM